MHQTKKADLLEEIHQLEDRTLPKYIEQVKKLELIQDNLYGNLFFTQRQNETYMI